MVTSHLLPVSTIPQFIQVIFASLYQATAVLFIVEPWDLVADPGLKRDPHILFHTLYILGSCAPDFTPNCVEIGILGGFRADISIPIPGITYR